jgi:hypothetical protein
MALFRKVTKATDFKSAQPTVIAESETVGFGSSSSDLVFMLRGHVASAINSYSGSSLPSLL